MVVCVFSPFPSSVSGEAVSRLATLWLVRERTMEDFQPVLRISIQDLQCSIRGVAVLGSLDDLKAGSWGWGFLGKKPAFCTLITP